MYVYFFFFAVPCSSGFSLPFFPFCVCVHVCLCFTSICLSLCSFVQCCSLPCLLLCFHWMSLDAARRPVNTAVPLWSAVYERCPSACVRGRAFFSVPPLCSLCTSFHLVFVRPLVPFRCFNSPPPLSTPTHPRLFSSAPSVFLRAERRREKLVEVWRGLCRGGGGEVKDKGTMQADRHAA